MVWLLIAVVYVGALYWSWQQQKGVAECRDVRLDFGDQVDEVEQALRLLANHAQRQGLCLNVYISATDDEAKAIAYRLSSSMPLNLVLDDISEDRDSTGGESM